MKELKNTVNIVNSILSEFIISNHYLVFILYPLLLSLQNLQNQNGDVVNTRELYFSIPMIDSFFSYSY
jgi:hypothetical protein